MGEIADLTINGQICTWCGTCFKKAHGYPVSCDFCWDDVKWQLSESDDITRKGKKIIMINGVQQAIYKEL